MKRFETTRRIAAAPDEVWAVLTNAAALGSGEFGITSLKGLIGPGAKLALKTAAAPKQTFKVAVTALDAPNTMIWTGGMPFGLFKGERTFSLEPIPGETATQFTMREVFSGPLAGMITKSMPDLTPSFETFAAALAARAEGTGAAAPAEAGDDVTGDDASEDDAADEHAAQA